MRRSDTTKNPSDRILPETRLVSAFIVPFLVLAFAVLYFLPHETDRNFAWPIGPQMTAMMLGATYLAGIYFFTMVALFARRWQQVKVGFIPVAVFASMMGIATILHWPNFSHGTLAFWLWAGLYFTTPFIVFGVWVRNRLATQGREAHDNGPSLPSFARIFIGIVGAIGVLTSLQLFVFPDLMIDVWPWTLSALTARTVAALFAVFSVSALGAYLDPRWESLRLVTLSQITTPAFFLIAMAVSWGDFDTANTLTWVFAFNVVVIFTAGVPALYLFMETRRRAVAVSS